MIRFNLSAVLLATTYAFSAGTGLAGQDIESDVEALASSAITMKEVVGFIAGFGTTFAAVPDLIVMLKRRSTVGMNPTMAAIMGTFQFVWVYYGFLIASRPVIIWNIVAVVINFIMVGAYYYFLRGERAQVEG
ncbi:MAG: SemiSWEET family transporter [Nitrospira sp.]|nr:SemiSWEET family transporter [Nitrospira sp.]